MSSANPIDTPEKIQSSNSPLPTVQVFERSSATVDDIVNALKLAGGVVVRNFLDLEDIDRILGDINPYLDSDKPWDGKCASPLSFEDNVLMLPELTGDFFPPETRRAFGLMGKSHTFATSIVGNPLWIGVTDALLTSHSKYNWVSRVQPTYHEK